MAPNVRAHKGGGLGVDPGVVGLYMKGMLRGKLSAFSRDQLALRGAVPPESARPQDIKSSKPQHNKLWLTGTGEQKHLCICLEVKPVVFTEAPGW